MNEGNGKGSLGRISTAVNSDNLLKETGALGKLSVSQNSDPVKDLKILPCSKTLQASSVSVSSAAPPRRNSVKSNSNLNALVFSKSDVTPVIFPRNGSQSEQMDSRKELTVPGKATPLQVQSKGVDCQRFPNAMDGVEKSMIASFPEAKGSKDMNIIHGVISCTQDMSTEATGLKNVKENQYIGCGKSEMDPITENITMRHYSYETRRHKMTRDACSNEGRIPTLPMNWDQRERSNYEQPTCSISPGSKSTTNNNITFNVFKRRGYHPSAEKAVSFTDEDGITCVMDRHDQFISSMQSRLGKLQAIFRFWERNDVKGVISTLEKMADDAVIADVVSIISEKIDAVTLDLFTCLLPLLAELLKSDMDRFLGISLEMTLKLVRIFGSVIYSTISAPASVGVDVEAEQRLERCNLCFIELERVKSCLPSLSRRGASVAKSAQELSLTLREVS